MENQPYVHLELVDLRSLELLLETALEPSGVLSAFEALRKSRPIVAEATTLGAVRERMKS